MRFKPFLGLILASAAVAQEAKQDSPLPYKVKPFAALSERAGGQWRAVWNVATNTPRQIYGTGIALEDWRENSLEEARRHANESLVRYRDLLGLGTSEFRESIGARMGRTWSFKFDQHFAGLPCIGGRADVRVNMKGVLAMIGSTAWPIPADFDTVPTISELQAKALAWIALDEQPTGVPQPDGKRQNRLVIWGDVFAHDTAPFHLAWEIPVSNVDRQGQGPIGRYYIDARTGAVLRFQSDKHECGFAACKNAHHGLDRLETVGAPVEAPLPVPTTVTVMGWTRDGLSATSPLTNRPLRGIEINVPGIGIRTTDGNGQFTIDISSAVTIAVSVIDGAHHDPIEDSSGNQPNASVNVQPGVNATLQLLTSGASQELASHVGVTYWVDEVNEWMRGILGNLPQINASDSVTPRVNTNGTCNAFYTGNSINFYPQGNGCNNTGFSTVVVHEWGHGIDDRFGGISNQNGDGLSEGWGDILGIYLADNPIVGIDFRPGGFVRTANNSRQWTSLTGGTGVHNSGEVWMGFAWDFRQQLRTAFGTPQAISISEDLVVCSIVADATNQPDAVAEVFLCDDDDGNLFNGTPHYTWLSAAAIGRSLPFPMFQPVTVQHVGLADTADRYTSRLVEAEGIANDAGTVTQVRLVYSAAGGPTQTRVMVPDGSASGYRGMLPGLPSGLMTYHIEATSTTGTGRFPLSGEIGYTVTTAPGGPFMQFYAEDFESGGAGWTHQQVATQDDWQLGSPNNASGTSFGINWQDPAAAANGSNCYANDLGGAGFNGAYQNNVENVLTSPIIDCTGRTGVTLRFNRWLSVEEGIYDQATIEVNGVEVWANQLNGNTQDTSWQAIELPLPSADNNPAVQVSFRLKTDGGLVMGGWNVDDVELGTRTPPMEPATLQMSPEQSGVGTTVNLAITTGGSQKLFVLVIGDTEGPTSVPGFPTAIVGGNLDFIVGFSDIAGFFNQSFGSIPGMPPSGILLYTQVLVFEAGGLFTLSNQHVNLFH